jgi:hypothetical protein
MIDATHRVAIKHLRPLLRRVLSTAALLALLMLIGCQSKLNPVNVIIPQNKPPPPLDPAVLQTEVLRLAGEYLNRTDYAIDDYARRAGTDGARRQAMQWKLNGSTSAVAIASGPNPAANLLDFMALTTVTRTALEEARAEVPNGAAFAGWLVTSRELETRTWTLAEQILTPEQRQEMHDAIGKWWNANPSVHRDLFVRPEEVGSFLRTSDDKSSRPGSVFGLLGLDPTAGLDPAVREVTRSRLFAERAMFVAMHTPALLRLQVDLVSDRLLREQQVTQALGSADRLSRAAESASHTAAELPDRITAERKAILADLDTQEGKLRALSAEVTNTLSAGDKMSTSLNTTLVTFNALMKRFGVGEPAPEPATPPGPPSPPFNILDYARTAEQLGITAQRLDELIKDAASTMDSTALDRRIAELQKASQGAQTDARSFLNHAFLLSAGLILLTFACAIVYRRTGRSSRVHRPMIADLQGAAPGAGQ